MIIILEHKDKPLLRGNVNIFTLLDDVEQYLGPLPIIDILPDGSYPDVSIYKSLNRIIKDTEFKGVLVARI